MRSSHCRILLLIAVTVVPTAARAQDLVVNGTTMALGGRHVYDTVRVINGGRINVVPFDGSDRDNTGNLELVAASIVVDGTSTISARGAGYQTPRCGDGAGPTATAGGRGGCSVRDSGGGGAHFGGGGRGTKDCFIVGSTTTCQFPWEFEQDCNMVPNAGGSACVTGGTGGGHGCWVQNGTGLATTSPLVSTCGPPPATCSGTTCCYDASIPTAAGFAPTIAGQPYWHSIWAPEFGAAGGDKGCRDGWDGTNVGGGGGGRIVLAGITAMQTGTVTITGTIDADGWRGCGHGNDSAGGGGGGTVLIVGDAVTINAGAEVRAAGGLGGDTQGNADCPPGAQVGGTCDDCGGGGGGGIVSVLSRVATISPAATFDIAGALGGTCPICQGEAGGGAGELQLNQAYVGEICDGYDNDFDGMIDEGLGTVGCGLGACGVVQDRCDVMAGEPNQCSPTVTADPTCSAAAICDRPRVAVILDSSASMLEDLSGYATFGDGSLEHPGLDTDGDGATNDSRLFLAKEALAQVISSYPEIDFALARYHQDQALGRSCQLASWIECAGIFATYDDPTDNTGPVACSVATSPTTSVTVRRDSSGGEECINYAGSCGGPRQGADIVAGFGTDTRDVVRWLDGRETSFAADGSPGDLCNHASGGDCELRATGPTPLQGALLATQDYLVPIKATDPCSPGCRDYTVILVTDGAESCGGDPQAAARSLFRDQGIEVHVVAVSVLPGERAELNRIAAAGSGGTRTATFVSNPEDLVPALTDIIAGAIRVESCNGLDDDCDGDIDEGFPGLADDCSDSGIGVCQGNGSIQCRADGSGTECVITVPGGTPGEEVCNGLDDNCNGRIDEGLMCSSVCVPSGAEVCNGVDDDCNGLIDEADPAAGTPCGLMDGICVPGSLRCVRGDLVCLGGMGGRDEVCNGVDDDCDGEIDEDAPCGEGLLCIDGGCRRPCNAAMEFPCPFGFVCEEPSAGSGTFCLPTACAECTAEERCISDRCVNACEGVACGELEQCVRGTCRDCHTLNCGSDEICHASRCVTDPCRDVDCAADEMCVDGSCLPACDDALCAAGERCGDDGTCQSTTCAAVTCDPGEYCDDGACRADPCQMMACRPGDVCVSRMGCIDDPCPVVRCPAGASCRANADGVPICAGLAADAGPSGRWVWAGGRGPGTCAVAPAAGAVPRESRDYPLGWVWLLVLGLALRFRRSL